MLRFACILAASLTFGAPVALAASQVSQGGVTGAVRVDSVTQAVRLAVERSLSLQAADAGRQASLGDQRQAGVMPNPELSIEAENFAGSGAYRGTRSLETTFGISQRLEIGGKRGARADAAQASVTLAELDYAAARLDLVRDVTKAYSAAVAAERLVDIEKERLRLADEVLKAVRGRVDAGKEPLIQVRKAEVTRSAARIAQERAGREADAARRTLANLLNVGRVDLRPNHAWFEDLGAAPRAVFAGLDTKGNPDRARRDAQMARSRAGLAAEQAAAIPDVTLRAGVRRFRESGDTAVVAGVAIPIPVFDRNQGAVVRARQELVRTEVEARKADLELEAALAEAELRLESSWQEAAALRREALPNATEAFALANEGYRSGKFSFLEMLDAQRTLFDVRAQLNQALHDAHSLRADIDRLSGAASLNSHNGDRP